VRPAGVGDTGPMPSTDFHPDLRRVARLAPRGGIGPRSLRVIRALSGLQRSRTHDGVAPLEDCYAALTWLAALPAVDPARVAIGGASAGGGLTAALALLARDRGEVTPTLQLLAYPMLDDRSASGPENPNYRLWTPKSNRFGWAAYLGNADPNVAVPARHEDLSGLPPTWIGVGTNDLLHDENLAYAKRLTAAGVPCDIEVVQGAFHGFDQVVPKAAVSQAFFASQCASLRSALAATS
jgi:acetyl esterase/lipase